jgi:hypothetical protein
MDGIGDWWCRVGHVVDEVVRLTPLRADQGAPYYAPPVVYGPGIGIALPGVSIGIR